MSLAKSTDAGANWQFGVARIPHLVHSVVLDPQNPLILYLGTEDGYVYKSTDGSASWMAVTDDHSINSIAMTVVIDPQNTSIIYASRSTVGIIKSTDGGQNWNFLNTSQGASPLEIPARPVV